MNPKFKSTKGNTKPIIKTKKVKNDFKSVANKLPKALVELVAIVKNNSEIRRFTSLAIINKLKQQGVISGDNNYVAFNWTKYTVTSNGLGIDYRYDKLFIDCLIGSFASFAAASEKTISDFINFLNNSPLKENVEETTEETTDSNN